MIAIDTDVLLSYLLEDNKTKSIKASNLILSFDSVLLTDVVLCEAIQALKSSCYNFNDEALSSVLSALFSEPNVRFENDMVIWRSFCDWQHLLKDTADNQQHHSGFIDILKLNKAKHMASLSNVEFLGFASFEETTQQVGGSIKL